MEELMQPQAHFGIINTPPKQKGESMTERKTQLLINEPPLQVLPSLAELLGLNEAIFLQQLHYWLGKAKFQDEDGVPWVYNTYDEWQEQFPFWGRNTIIRTIYKLEGWNVLRTTERFNSFKSDRTKWYTIDYEHLATLPDPLPKMGSPTTQNG
jgi:hypothetical protein